MITTMHSDIQGSLIILIGCDVTRYAVYATSHHSSSILFLSIFGPVHIISCIRLLPTDDIASTP
jgi:hypothetical protein